MTSVVEHKNIIAFHPGYYVKEIMRESNLGIDNFAKKTNLTQKQVSDLIQGRIDVSNFLATCLETEFQVSAAVWLNLQKMYDETISKIGHA